MKAIDAYISKYFPTKENWDSYDLLSRELSKADKDIQLEAVKRNGCTIEYIPNPDKDVQLEAVKGNGYAIEFIPNPDKDIQLEAVKERNK